MGGFLFCGMKHFCLALLSLFIFQFAGFAQKQVISTATDFIIAKNYKGADRYLDSVLKKNPKNVDALMMKGNVILNLAMDTTRPMQFVSENDESVFFSEEDEKPKLLSPRAVYSIEKYWHKALAFDSTRADIRKGLCTVYAMALMKDSLQREIIRLLKIEEDDGEQAFRTCEYARKFKERNRFKDGMEIYQFIAKLFPKVAGVRCDIASEYFYEGKMNEALAWLDSTYNFKTVDETSFLNGAFTYSLLGYFDDAQNVLNTYSNIYQRKMDRFYYGLRLFSDSSESYAAVLNEFCNAVDTNAYYNEVLLARRLLTYKDTFTLNDYKALVDDKEIQDYYKVLIHQRAFKQFKNNCEPFLIYGVLQSSIKNYSAAVQFLEEGENCNMRGQQSDYWLLHYAYTLYRTGDKEKAMLYFKPLINSSNLFTAQAAVYFSSKIMIAIESPAEGRNLLKVLSTSKTPTKYARLAGIVAE